MAAAEAKPVTYSSMLRTSPRHHQLFVATVVAQCLCILIERAWLFAYANLASDADARQAVYFLVVIALSTVFVLYFAVHSMLQANAFETVAFFVASALLLGRLAAEYVSKNDECAEDLSRGPLLNPQSICVGFLGFSVFFVCLAMGFTNFIFRDLAWVRYKAIGADVLTRRMYKLYELFSAVRKLDLQFSLITLVTGLVFFVPPQSPAGAAALAANIALFALEIVWERLGDRGIKGEEPRALYAFWALSPLLPAFIVAVAADTFASNASPCGDQLGGLLARATKCSLRTTIAIMGVLAILTRVATVVCSVVLYLNFGPNYIGLRRIIMGDRKSKFQHAAREMADFGGAAAVANPVTTLSWGGTGAAVASGPGRPSASEGPDVAAVSARAQRVGQLAKVSTVAPPAPASLPAPPTSL